MLYHPLTQVLLCEIWHFTRLWKTIVWPHHSPRRSFAPIKLILYINVSLVYRCCLFLRLLYLILELFPRCVIICFHFIIYILPFLSLCVWLVDDDMFTFPGFTSHSLFIFSQSFALIVPFVFMLYMLYRPSDVNKNVDIKCYSHEVQICYLIDFCHCNLSTTLHMQIWKLYFTIMTELRICRKVLDDQHLFLSVIC